MVFFFFNVFKAYGWIIDPEWSETCRRAVSKKLKNILFARLRLRSSSSAHAFASFPRGQRSSAARKRERKISRGHKRKPRLNSNIFRGISERDGRRSKKISSLLIVPFFPAPVSSFCAQSFRVLGRGKNGIRRELCVDRPTERNRVLTSTDRWWFRVENGFNPTH